MPASRLSLSLLTAALAAGCSPSPESRATELCQAEMKTWIPNPDSAEFLSLSAITQQEWEAASADILIRRLNQDGPMGDFFAAQIRSGSRRAGESIRAENGSFYRYGYRFRSSAGATRSSVAFCAVTEKECACASSDKMNVQAGVGA